MKTEQEIREQYEKTVLQQRCHLDDYEALKKMSIFQHDAKAHLEKANRLKIIANALEWVLDD